MIILPISVLRVVAMVLVQIEVVLWSLMMTVEVQVALVRTHSGAVLCLLENRKIKKSEHDFVTFRKEVCGLLENREVKKIEDNDFMERLSRDDIRRLLISFMLFGFVYVAVVVDVVVEVQPADG